MEFEDIETEPIAGILEEEYPAVLPDEIRGEVTWTVYWIIRVRSRCFPHVTGRRARHRKPLADQIDVHTMQGDDSGSPAVTSVPTRR